MSSARFWCQAAIAGMVLAGCEDPPAQSRGAAPARVAPSARVDAGVADSESRPALTLNDSDFTENDRTRDPFRSFAREFVPIGPQVQVVENEIKLREYALDELRLVAVVIGTGNPYAMVVDPSGRGTIIRRGEYVGRPETISSGPEGSMPHQVPWRVARIVGSRVHRSGDHNLTEIPGEVVFEREDRLNPSAARAERTISLNPGQSARTGTAAAPPASPQALPPLPGFGPGGSFLPPLPTPGAGPSANAGAAGVPGQAGATYVQSYTTVVPPQPAAPAQPTTVVIQTGPQGQTTVMPGGVGPRDPYAPPQGGSDQPPAVQVHNGPNYPQAPLPSSGLPR